MAMKPVYKPVGEVTTDINGMFVGKSLNVFGKIHDDAEKFFVNLQCGSQNDDDIALHVNVRLSEGQVVRNTRSNGWGQEERHGDLFPFKQGGYFDIMITCMRDHFLIGINGRDAFAKYDHRLPFASVTHLSVGQHCDAILLSSSIDGAETPVLTISNPSLGSTLIPFNNYTQRKIQIVGTPTNPNGRIDINLVTGDGQICLHYNPRLNEKQVVRNSKGHAGWGNEQRSLNFEFPFHSAVPFQTTIIIKKEEFVVEINGMTAFVFFNRIEGSADDIRTIEILQDVKIEKITFV